MLRSTLSLRGDEAEHAGMRLLRHPLGNHPVLAYALGGSVGGAAGLRIATNALHVEGLFTSRELFVWTPAAGGAGTVAGVVAGWFVVALILSWAPGRIKCPRCGTSSERDESIRIRLSAREKATLQQIAADAGESVSAYVRRTCGL